MTKTMTPPKATPYDQLQARRARYFADGAAVLPCSDIYGRFNPAQPAGPWYDDHGPAFMVLAKTRDGKATRVLPSFASVGTWIVLRHDQTGAKLGEYYIVGGMNEEGDVFGQIPDAKLSVGVFK